MARGRPRQGAQTNHGRAGADATQVMDVDLKEVTALKNLQSLNLFGTKVTDVGLKELAVLKNLQSLDLQDTKVTDMGLKELAR